jgi:hypothetical protein
LIRGRRFIEHSTKFRRLLLRLRGLSLGVGNLVLKLHRLLERGQQQPVAFRYIAGQKIVIHVTFGCNNSS